MKRLSIAIAAAVAIAASVSAASAQTSGAANFGSPPSGEVPILFNDQHVYTKPDELEPEPRSRRARARQRNPRPVALDVRADGCDGFVRSGTKTADVSKPGSDVKVTVGKPEVVINGESRPLDVPPEIYKGASSFRSASSPKAWAPTCSGFPEKQRRRRPLRSGAGSDPAADGSADGSADPADGSADAAAAASAAAAARRRRRPRRRPPAAYYEHFIVGDYIFKPKVYNEFSNGHERRDVGSVIRRARSDRVPARSTLPFMIEGYGEQYAYTHPGGAGIPRNTNCETAVSGRESGLRHADRRRGQRLGAAVPSDRR